MTLPKIARRAYNFCYMINARGITLSDIQYLIKRFIFFLISLFDPGDVASTSLSVYRGANSIRVTVYNVSIRFRLNKRLSDLVELKRGLFLN